METIEIVALFGFGRRWLKLHLACQKPVDPLKIRAARLDEAREVLQDLSISIPTFPSPTRSPGKFGEVAQKVFLKIVTGIAISRGAQAAGVVQLAALYYSFIVSSKAARKEVADAKRELRECLSEFGMSSRKRSQILKRIYAMQAETTVKHTDEAQLANDLVKAVARAIAEKSGIKVGEAILKNSIQLPNDSVLALPKRLVGYRNEMERFLKKFPYSRNVFLMMPFRDATKRLRTRIRAVCQKYKLNLIVADEQRIVENDLNSNVLACLLASSFGIAAFSRPESKQTINPNVSYELGMMHRDDKPCLILKDRRLKKLPTDLIGHLYVDYVVSDKQSIISHVETWIQDRVLGSG